MAKQGTILVVDDNKGILTAVQMLLGTCFEKVITISTPNKIKTTLHNENVDVVLLDMNFSAGINTGNEGLFWLSEIKKEDPAVQVVLFTAYADIDLAVKGHQGRRHRLRCQTVEQCETAGNAENGFTISGWQTGKEFRTKAASRLSPRKAACSGAKATPCSNSAT